MADAQRLALLDNPLFVADLVDSNLSGAEIARKWGIGATAAKKWRRRLRERDGLPTQGKVAGIKESFSADSSGNLKYELDSERVIPLSEWLTRLRADGYNPEDFTHSHGHSVWTQADSEGDVRTLYANRFSAARKTKPLSGVAEWQPIDRGPAFNVTVPAPKWNELGGQWKTAVLSADHQIGFRVFDNGDVDPFHDDRAINLFEQIVDIERPDQVVIMGDFLDMTEQSKYVQEAAFARTTQLAIDRATEHVANLRARTPGQIVVIEGNHDKRMQNYVEVNALAAFGLRKGGMPESFPVMSLPNLLRLDEFDAKYMDAYPAAHWWINDKLRAEHGTKANSRGSTASAYANETPHFSRAFGHTHRLEAQSHTTYDRLGKIKSVAINPGCLCRVDGAVPSVNGATGADGRPAVVYENWQQGVAVIRYKDSGEFFWDLVQIEDGESIFENGHLQAA